MLGQGNRDQTCQTCWKQLPCGFKILFVFTLAYNVLSLVFGFLLTTFYFDGYLVVHNLHVWRLLIPYIPAGPMPFSILNILINFMWLLSIYPLLEKKFSTVYILIETFLQNFMINLVLTVFSLITYYLFGVSPEQYRVLTYGMFPLCMVFIWYQAAQNPDQHTTFCCMPCLIPMKWIPVIILVFCLMFATNLLLPLTVAFALGYLQFMHFKRRLIKLPLKFYRKIDLLLPKAITDRPDYVKVVNVQNDLRGECSQVNNNIGGGNANPFNRNQPQQNQVAQQPNKVQVFGKGVQIGGGNVNVQNYKGFWANKVEQNQQIEIEPVPVQSQSPNKNARQGVDTSYFTAENDSKLHLQLNSSDQKSEEDFAQKAQKKVQKQNLLE